MMVSMLVGGAFAGVCERVPGAGQELSDLEVSWTLGFGSYKGTSPVTVTRTAGGELVAAGACKTMTDAWWSTWNPRVRVVVDAVEQSIAHLDEFNRLERPACAGDPTRCPVRLADLHLEVYLRAPDVDCASFARWIPASSDPVQWSFNGRGVLELCSDVLTPDLVGHEFAHLLMQKEYLRYLYMPRDGEPGALRESMADLFGHGVACGLLSDSTAGCDWDFPSGDDVKPRRTMAEPWSANRPATTMALKADAGCLKDPHCGAGVPNRATVMVLTGVSDPAYAYTLTPKVLTGMNRQMKDDLSFERWCATLADVWLTGHDAHVADEACRAVGIGRPGGS